MMLFLRIKSNIFILLQLVALVASGESPPVPVFSNGELVHSSNGHFLLRWEVNPIRSQDLSFELQQSEDPGFSNGRTIYEGPDRASFISGLKDGNYYFRIRTGSGAEWGDWSEAIELRVTHHSMELAFGLFGLGGAVFILTVLMLFIGIRKNDTDHAD